MSSRSKQHHYVPRVLQRSFANPAGQLWYTAKGDDGRFSTPELRNLSSTFKARNYYTTLERGKSSDVVERDFYGEVDNFLGEFCEHVMPDLKRGLVPKLNKYLADGIRSVMFYLIKRTPDFSRNYDDAFIGSQICSDVLRHAAARGFSQEAINLIRNQYSDVDYVRRIGRSVRVKTQIQPAADIEDELMGFSIRWVFSRGKSSFVLASGIAYRIGNGGSNGLSNPNMEIWVPLTPKSCLVLVRDRMGRIPPSLDLSADHVRQVNLFAVEEFQEVVSHSDSLLNSLINRR